MYATIYQDLFRRLPWQDLGMELPSGFSEDIIGRAVGLEKRVHTIDVTTQQSGPRLTLGRHQLHRHCLINAKTESKL